MTAVRVCDLAAHRPRDVIILVFAVERCLSVACLSLSLSLSLSLFVCHDSELYQNGLTHLRQFLSPDSPTF